MNKTKPKRKKKTRRDVEGEIQRRVEEELQRRKDEEWYNAQYQAKIDAGLCGRCGSRHCVCE